MSRAARRLAVRLQAANSRGAALAGRLAALQAEERRHFIRGVAAAGRSAAIKEQTFAAAIAAAYERKGDQE